MKSPLQAWVRALALTAPIERRESPTLPILLETLAERSGTTLALSGTNQSLRYDELAASINRYARWGLEQGLAPGEAVGLLVPNCPDYLAIWLGLTRVGVVVALLNTNIRGASLAHCIDAVSPRHIIVATQLWPALAAARPHLRDAPRFWAYGPGIDALPRIDLQAAPGRLTLTERPAPALDDPALYIYTSGTTGLPKAAKVSHLRLMQWSHWFAGLMDTQPSDRMYNCLPLYHSVGGVVAVGATLVSGGTVIIRERFSASHFWADVVAERCTLFQYIGELCRYLLAGPSHADETQHQLRLCCGNGLRPEVWQPFRERFRIPRVLEYYASTEGSFSLYNCEEQPGAIGRIPPFLAHRTRVELVKFDPAVQAPLRDAAGLCIRCGVGEVGEALGGLGGFEGYSDPQATGQKICHDVLEPGDAWYRTGDLLRKDAQGFYYFVDRVGDTFRWKGENVSASEVSAVICECPGVQDAAVFGVEISGADGRAGMAALVVSAEFDVATLQSHLEARLPAYARPLYLRIVPALEVTGTFKLRKQELAAQGYDAAQVTDPMFHFDGRGYVPITPYCPHPPSA